MFKRIWTCTRILHGVTAEERRERYPRLMEMTALGPFTQRLAGRLSGGMKQKLGLACTLVRAPELLLLDEPTVGVDPLSRRELWDIILQLVDDQGLTVLLSTSYLDEAERCEHVVVMHQGKVLAQGRPEDVSGLAAGRVFIAEPPAGQKASEFQARLLDQPGVSTPCRKAAACGSYEPDADAERDTAPGRSDRRRRSRDSKTDLWCSCDERRQGHSETHRRQAMKPRRRRRLQSQSRQRRGRPGTRSGAPVRQFRCRRPRQFRCSARRDLRPAWSQRRGQDHHFSHALRVAAGDQRHVARGRRGLASRARFGATADRLCRPEVLALRSAFGDRESGFFCQRLQSARRRKTRAHRLGPAAVRLAPLADLPSGHLPGGFKQRLAMAAALLHEPEILFLDEPTSGADPLARREFWRRITALAEQGVTVVVTTHFMEEAEYCDRVAIMDAGRVLAQGTPAEIRSRALQDGEPEPTMEDAFIAVVEEARENETNRPAERARGRDDREHH